VSNNHQHRAPAPEVWSLHSEEFEEEERSSAQGSDSIDQMEVCSVEEEDSENDDQLDDHDPNSVGLSKIPQKTEIFEGQVV